MSESKSFDPYALDHHGIQEPPATLGEALLKIGPGIILAGSIVGSGELIVTTSLGAKFGFMLMWLILFSCVIKVFVQIELGRYAISSGKPTLKALNEFPGIKFGAHWLVWWWFFMLLATVCQLGGMTGGIGQSLHLAFPHLPELPVTPQIAWSIAICALTIILLWSGTYRRVEVLTTALVVGVTLLTVACVMALRWTDYPIHLSELMKGFTFAIPSSDKGGLMVAFSMFGITGVGASELYSYPYWCLEKGYARYVGPDDGSEDWLRRAKGWIRVMHLDAWASMIVFSVATVAFYAMGAAVLYPQGLVPDDSKMIETLSQMYVGPFGQWTQLVFLIGAGAVLFKTLYVSCASHSRLTADFFSLGGFVNFKDHSARAKCIQALCLFYPVLALVLFLGIGNPKQMVIFGGVAQGLTLPIISGATLYMRYYKTDRRIAPSFLSDLLLWIAVILISAVALVSLVSQVQGWLAPAK